MWIVPEREIAGLMTRAAAFDAVEKVFAAMAAGEAYNFPVVREAIGHADALYGFKGGFDRAGMTLGLKAVAQDRGPNGEGLAWPSGHTASTMTVATVMNEFYGPWVGVPLYALSGLVMYERIETREHWASDIVFGAAIGYTVGKVVAARHKPEIFGMQLLPYLNPETGSTGLVLAKRF